MSAFIFSRQDLANVAHRAEISAGITSKVKLLDEVSIALHFPDYFGGNWDALDECIRDLSWLPVGDIILSHRDLPLSEDRSSLSTYLLILKDAVEKWSATGERQLFVVFPADAESIVENLIAA